MILKNCTFFNEFFEKEFGDIKIENGKIAQIGYFNEDGKDMSGKIILPGFVDIHIHGGGGGDFCDATPQSVDLMSTYLAKHGVTSFCGTTMTLPHSKLKEIVANASDHNAKKSKLVGINLEGPYIALSKKGAQNGEYVRGGSIDELNELIDAGKGKIKIITVAPEAENNQEFVKKASQMLCVSVGHSNANAKECQTAFDNGARLATHLFNAMTPMTHREAGVVGTALDNKNVACELICDGEHICPAVLRNAFANLGDNRACVISDSMRGAGLGVGEFELGGQTAYVKEGYKVAKLADGTIAASITNVFDEFKNLVNWGIDFVSALKACTINPATVIGEQENIGSIAIGKWADLLVVDDQLNLEEVYINGEIA